MHDELLESGLPVYGVSPQSAAIHERFRAQHQLPFPLLADTRKTLIRAFGVNGPLGFGVRRATFRIDQQGYVTARYVSDFNVGGHTDFLRDQLS